METQMGNTRVVFVKGDLTEQDTQAIVNAANSSLMGGGGVDGAIHRAGGPRILEQCIKIRALQGGCPTGQAVITEGGLLKAAYVIHTVGPVWQDGINNEDDLLRNAYLNSLNLAKENSIRSIAFPSISTGTYRFPVQRAAQIAVSAVREFLQSYDFDEVRFVLFNQPDLLTYEQAWKNALVRDAEDRP